MMTIEVLVRTGTTTAAQRAALCRVTTAIDPVCGMTVDLATATITLDHDGTSYAFCAPVALIRRFIASCNSSQIPYPYGRTTMVPRTGPLSASSALAITSWNHRGKSVACAASTDRVCVMPASVGTRS